MQTPTVNSILKAKHYDIVAVSFSFPICRFNSVC